MAGTPTLALVLAIDANRDVARGLAVTLHSTLRHLSVADSVGVYVLDSGLSPDSWRRLQRVVARVGGIPGLHRIVLDERRFATMPVSSQGSAQFPPAVYARLMVADLLPTSIERVLYLDCDLLIHEDLAPLLATDLRGMPIGAARDLGILTTDHEWSGIPHSTESRPYFNSGVLVLDLERWRREGVGDRVLAYAESQSTLRWVDQDALNAVIDRWHQLDQRWNVQVGTIKNPRLPAAPDDSPSPASPDDSPSPDGGQGNFPSVDELLRAPAISHFSGGKPWDPVCNSPGVTAWVTALVRSGWYSPIEMAIWLGRWAALRGAYGARAKIRRTVRQLVGRAARA